MVRVGNQVPSTFMFVKCAIVLHIILGTMQDVDGEQNEPELIERKLNANSFPSFNFHLFVMKYLAEILSKARKRNVPVK